MVINKLQIILCTKLVVIVQKLSGFGTGFQTSIFNSLHFQMLAMMA
jgi:hypothetical protein